MIIRGDVYVRLVFKLFYWLEMSERLLRPRDVCRVLGVSYATLRRWVREGEGGSSTWRKVPHTEK